MVTKLNIPGVLVYTYICEVDYITFKVDLLEKYFDGLWKTQCSSQLDAGDPSTCPWEMDGL